MTRLLSPSVDLSRGSRVNGLNDWLSLLVSMVRLGQVAPWVSQEDQSTKTVPYATLVCELGAGLHEGRSGTGLTSEGAG
jgi:hypothetical protein